MGQLLFTSFSDFSICISLSKIEVVSVMLAVPTGLKILRTIFIINGSFLAGQNRLFKDGAY